jgi:hypothetical protein
LPLFQFVLWRSLFRWGLWASVLAGLGRVPLRLLPMHVDRRGGIGFLKRPSHDFCVVLLLGLSSALCGGWGTWMLLYGAKVETFKPLFVAFVLVGLTISFLPLLALTPQLVASRRRGRKAYGGLVRLHERHRGALDRSARRGELLGIKHLVHLLTGQI